MNFLKKLFGGAAHSPSEQVQSSPVADPRSDRTESEAGSSSCQTVSNPPEDLSAKLLEAAKIGSLDEVQRLLAAGAETKAKETHGWTALHLAAGKGHQAVVQRLLSAGAETEARDLRGFTALHLAAGKGHSSTVQSLLIAGADTKATTHDGFTALHLAAGQGHASVVQSLLAAGADTDAKTFSVGGTALEFAEAEGHTAVVQLLQIYKMNLQNVRRVLGEI